MERERYDGADIAHLLQANAELLDWAGLLERFGSHWREAIPAQRAETGEEGLEATAANPGRTPP